MNDEDLTDLFAGLAMQELLRTSRYPPSVAADAYDFAEAMIKEKRDRNERRKGILAPQGD